MTKCRDIRKDSPDMFCLHPCLPVRRCLVWIPKYFCEAIRCRRTGNVCCCCETGEPGDLKSTIDVCVSSRLMRKPLLPKIPLSRYMRSQPYNRQEVVIEMSRIESRKMPSICLLFWKVDI